MQDPKKRTLLVERARSYLETAGRPRLVMTLVLTVTVAAGYLASIAMVHLGLERMSIRYPLAVAVAYATFLGLLRAWLLGQSAASMLEGDPEGLLIPGVAAAVMAAAVVDDPADDEDEGQVRVPTRSGGSGGSGGSLDLGDLGEGVGALVILVLIAVACTLIVSLYVVATSPILLAELLVDGAMLGAMTRAISPDPAPHWSRAAIRRTLPAALITAIVFGLVGSGIEAVAPGARTLGEAWSVGR